MNKNNIQNKNDIESTEHDEIDNEDDEFEGDDDIDEQDDNEDEGDGNDDNEDDDGDGNDDNEDEGEGDGDEGDDNNENEVDEGDGDDNDNEQQEVMDGEENENENDDFDDLENNTISFHNDLRRSYINEYHPELKNIPYAEMDILTKVTRNKFGNVIDPLHKTLPKLLKFERTKILGIRSCQLDNGSEPLVDIPDNDTFIPSYIIAEKELNSKKLGFFIIMRPLPNGKREYWKLDDLEIDDL